VKSKGIPRSTQKYNQIKKYERLQIIMNNEHIYRNTRNTLVLSSSSQPGPPGVRGTAPARRVFPGSQPKNYTNQSKSGGSKTNATASSKLNK
jgi:hypothetical protein